jgi:hypothetical protein
LQGNIKKVEESTKLKFLCSTFPINKLATLLLGVLKKNTKMKIKVTSTNARRISRTTRITMTKVINIFLRLKILITVKMKWYILL